MALTRSIYKLNILKISSKCLKSQYSMDNVLYRVNQLQLSTEAENEPAVEVSWRTFVGSNTLSKDTNIVLITVVRTILQNHLVAHMT